MNRFHYERAFNPQQAVARRALLAGDGAERLRPRFLAGGTQIVDLWRAGVMQPSHLIDISRVALDEIAKDDEGGMLLGALASNAATANHPLVAESFPLLRSAILAGASPQIRNRATNGGNLLQRTRCLYFYDVDVPCNKRSPGSGCPAVNGLARQHAILGATEACIATHPSDLCVALAALDAEVHVAGPRGARAIAFADFHRLPGDQPERDTELEPGELITHLRVPPNALQKHSCYLKIRERSSYAFALVSVAAALQLDEAGQIVDARVALGGVAHKPWRDLEAERLLRGAEPTATSFQACADHLLREARAWGGTQGMPGAPTGNHFKIPMASRAIVRALEMARDGLSTNTGEDAARAMGKAEHAAPSRESA